MRDARRRAARAMRATCRGRRSVRGGAGDSAGGKQMSGSDEVAAEAPSRASRAARRLVSPAAYSSTSAPRTRRGPVGNGGGRPATGGGRPGDDAATATAPRDKEKEAPIAAGGAKTASSAAASGEIRQRINNSVSRVRRVTATGEQALERLAASSTGRPAPPARWPCANKRTNEQFNGRARKGERGGGEEERAASGPRHRTNESKNNSELPTPRGRGRSQNR